MALTENEQRLLDGFKWLANVHHEVQHNALQEKGMHDFRICDAKTCKYARSIVEWGELQ